MVCKTKPSTQNTIYIYRRGFRYSSDLFISLSLYLSVCIYILVLRQANEQTKNQIIFIVV